MSGIQEPQSYNDEKTLRVSHVLTGETQVAKNLCIILKPFVEHKNFFGTISDIPLSIRDLEN